MRKLITILAVLTSGIIHAQEKKPPTLKSILLGATPHHP
jgi:hypothetical protein